MIKSNLTLAGWLLVFSGILLGVGIWVLTDFVFEWSIRTRSAIVGVSLATIVTGARVLEEFGISIIK